MFLYSFIMTPVYLELSKKTTKTAKIELDYHKTCNENALLDKGFSELPNLLFIVSLDRPYPEDAFVYDEDVNRRTIEISQRTRIIMASHCLKVHNAP